MCGIIGRIEPGPCSGSLLPFLSRMQTRGPNEQGERSFSSNGVTSTLSMARLSITDYSTIGVPYYYPEIGVCLAMNGEIWNWQDLVRQHGLELKTSCDAEVVAHLWRRFGPEMLHQFNGMFAIFLYDIWDDRTFVARDRAGVKPLYYTESNGQFLFASEIKALPIRLVPTLACPEYEVFEFDCLETTMFDGVRCFPPGHYATVEGDRLDIRRWWSLPTSTIDISERDAVEHLTYLIEDAVELRLPCHEPAAIMLSGGLDSSIIQALVKSPNLYCVSFKEIDNLSVAMGASCGEKVCGVSFDRAMMEEVLDTIALALDSPATWTAVCEYFLFKAIKQDGIRIALSGEGADEIFHGYTRYRLLYWLQRAKHDPLLEAYAPTFRHLHGTDLQILSHLISRSTNESCNIASAFMDQSLSLVRNMARIEFHTTMQVLLRMPDRMAGLFSIENRTPFLDYRIMEFGSQLPDDLKMTSSSSKTILRTIARNLGVPNSIVNEKTKRGLAIPFADWYGPTSGSRGAWDRSLFKRMMLESWLRAFQER